MRHATQGISALFGQTVSRVSAANVFVERVCDVHPAALVHFADIGNVAFLPHRKSGGAMNRHQIQLGFLLILLGLLTGLGMPVFVSPRLGLAAHTVAITGGLVLIALGALARSFLLGRRSATIMMWSWAYAAYANWAACLIAAATGASRLTPIAGAGRTGSVVAENVVALLLQSLALAALLGTTLAVWGFRKPTSARVGQSVESGLAST